MYNFIQKCSHFIYIKTFYKMFRWLQTRYLFNPSSLIIWRPKFPYFTQIRINHLTVWKFMPYPTRPIVLYLNGNIENMSYNKDIFDTCYILGFNLIMFDYSGFGLSSGIPHIYQLLSDSLSVYTYVLTHFPTYRVILWGDSLGCSISSYLSSLYQPWILILMGGFSSLSDVLCDRLGILGTIISPIFKLCIHNLDTTSWLKKISSSVIFIHSIYDTDINYANCIRNYNAIQHHHKYIIHPDGTHCRPIITSDNIKHLSHIIHQTDTLF